MAYQLPVLPYAHNALEPYIDERTMQIHHGKHHQAYVNNLNTALASKNQNWKFRILSVIALILALGVFTTGSVLAAATGTVASGGLVVAGSTGNTITIQLSGATVGQNLSITPPAGWSPMSNAGAGLTVVTGGNIVTAGTQNAPAIVINPTATSLTIVYGSGGGSTGAKIGTKVEVTSFAVRDPDTSTNPTSTIPIVATADGSGTVLVNNATVLNVLAGVSGQTFRFLYTAVGTAAENPGILNGGELTLTIPAGWTAPTSSNISVNGNPSGDAPPDSASVGPFSILGSGPWTVSVPLNAMDGAEQVEIQYQNVTVPSTTGTYIFPMQVRGFSGSLTLIRVVTSSGSLEINATVAGRGSGAITVSGGPVSAGSTGNTLTFIYTAEGTMDGGGLELIPPSGWTEPQGSPGSPGYTTVEFLGGASGTLGFSEDKGDNRPDFTGKGVNVLFTRMRAGEQVKIIYGAGGGNNGATAPSTVGLSFFDVFAAPNFPIGNAEGQAGDARFPDDKRSFVSIQAPDGSGTVAVTDKSGDRFTNAGEQETLTFTFTATGTMNGGLFSATVDDSWPIPTSDNTQVTSTGAVDAAIFLQREIRVPIVFLSAAQTITVTYGKPGKEVSAPGIPETSAFVFKSQGTPNGILAVIPEPNPGGDPPNFAVKVGQAKDGSGTAIIPDNQKKVTASSTGRTFTITYKAIGQMDGGKLNLTSPESWTKLKDHVSISLSPGAVLANPTFSNGDQTVTYDLVTLERDQTVTFTYSTVDVQSTTGSVTLLVKSQGSAGGFLANLTAGSPVVTVDNVADGSGTASITPNSVPATDNRNFTMKYVGTQN